MKIFQIMRSNNDGKYKFNEFNEYYEFHIIKRRFTVLDTLEKNGVSKQKILHLPML